MNLLERVLTLLRANLNTMAEKSDDPEKTLRQLQLDMRNQLVQVKTQVATAIAEKMKFQKRNKEKQTEANLWLKRAEQAIQQNNEQSARDFLSRYNDLNRQIERYQQQQREQDQLVATMRGILRQLEAKISEVDTTIDLLAARKRSALLQQRVYDTLSKSASPKDRERAMRAQDALLEIEARARALADLQQQDLEVQLEQLTQEQLIEQQLQQLKEKKSQKAEPPLLLEEKAQFVELTPPLSEQKGPAASKPPSGSVSKSPRLLPSRDDEVQELNLDALRKLMDN